jgi:hypothetical protein
VQVHGIGPWLHARLAGEAHGSPGARIGEGAAAFLAYLADCHAMNTERMALWQVELEGLLHEAGRLGVPLVALKGAAVLPFVWPAPALRPTSDIDLLARSSDHNALDDACRRRGWTFQGENPRHRTWYLARLGLDAKSDIGEHPAQPLRLEVHFHATQTFLGLRHDATEALWRDATRQRVGSAMMLVPDPVHTFEHMLMHTAFDLAKRATRMIKLEDLRLLAGQLSREAWEGLVSRMTAAGLSRFALAPLVMAERYLADAPGATRHHSGNRQPVRLAPERTGVDRRQEPIAPDFVMEALSARADRALLAWLRATPLSEFTACGARGAMPANAWWRLRWFGSTRERVSRARYLLMPTRAERLEEFVAVGQAPGLWAYYRAQVARWRRESSRA